MENMDVLSKDIIVASYRNGQLTIVNEDLVPFYLKRTGNLEGWLAQRAIDSHRTNSRILKRMLRLRERDDVGTVLAAHGATITDTYWVRPIGSYLRYCDVVFRDNQFADVALLGRTDGLDVQRRLTPELTNTGSYEKCWRSSNGHWTLCKLESFPSQFSELFTSKLGRIMGMNVVDYSRVSKDVVSCLDFTNGAAVNFEDASSLLQEEDELDFSLNYQIFHTFGETVASDYAKMLYLDAITMNVDRHIHNYGILRDVETGKVLQFAPLFDHNLTLLAHNDCTAPYDSFLSDYREFFEKEHLPMPAAKEEQVDHAYRWTCSQFTAEELERIPNRENILSFVAHSQEIMQKPSR